MSQSLCFNDFTFSPVIHDNQPWIPARQLANALGYKDERSVHKIYERNKDEFSSMMSTVVNLTTGVMELPTRIFSLRGCHLLAMHSGSEGVPQVGARRHRAVRRPCARRTARHPLHTIHPRRPQAAPFPRQRMGEAGEHPPVDALASSPGALPARTHRRSACGMAPRRPRMGAGQDRRTEPGARSKGAVM